MENRLIAPRELPESLRDRYQGLGILGAGGMGTVYRARDLSLDRLVAVKLLRLAPREEILLRFQREAQLMARIQHPHLIRVYEVGQVPEGPYLVLELIDGAPPEKGCPPALLERLAVEIGSGLEAMHEVGLVHRDVKPGNILVTRESRFVLADFGLAYDPDLTGLTEEGAVVGTLPFLAPERLRGSAPAPAQDSWALGVTLFYLLEERFPFEVDQLTRSAMGRKLPPPTYSRAREGTPLRHLVEALLAQDPEARPGTRERIEAVLRGEVSPPVPPVPAPLPAGGELGPPETPRGSRVRLMVLGGALLLGGLLGWGGGPPEGALPSPAPTEQTHAEVPDRPWPEGLGERVRSDYRSLEGRVVSPRGEVLEEWEAPDGTPRLLGPDPLWYGVLLRSLPSLEAPLAWIRSHEARDLTPALREELEGVDAFFRGQDLPEPFRVFRTLEPLDPEEESVEPPLPRGLDRGWAGRAMLLLRKSRRAVEEKRAEWAAGGEEVRSLTRGVPGLGLFQRKMSRGIFLQARLSDRTRVEFSLWARRIEEDYAALFFAVGRCLRLEPPSRMGVAARVGDNLHHLREFFPVSMACLDFRVLLSLDPQGPEDWYLLSQIELRRERIREELPPLEPPPGSVSILEALSRAREALGKRGGDPAFEVRLRHAEFSRLDDPATKEQALALLEEEPRGWFHRIPGGSAWYSIRRWIQLHRLLGRVPEASELTRIEARIRELRSSWDREGRNLVQAEFLEACEAWAEQDPEFGFRPSLGDS